MATTTTVSYGNFYLQKRLQYGVNTSYTWYVSTSINNSYIKNSAGGSAVADSALNTYKTISFTLPTIASNATVYLKGSFTQESENDGTLNKVTNAGKDIRYNGTSIGSISGTSQELSFDVTAAAKANSGGTLSMEFIAMMSAPEVGSTGSAAGEYSYLMTTYQITNLRLEIVTPDSGTLYYHNGSGWQKCEAYYYNGSSWIKCEAYRYDGTSWEKCGCS